MVVADLTSSLGKHQQPDGTLPLPGQHDRQITDAQRSLATVLGHGANHAHRAGHPTSEGLFERKRRCGQ